MCFKIKGNNERGKVFKPTWILIGFGVFVLCLLIILFGLGILKLNLTYNTTSFGNGEEAVIAFMQLILTVLIAIVGVYLFLFKNNEEKRNYLRLQLNVVEPEDTSYIKLRTEVINTTSQDRKIHSAFLIITCKDTNLLVEINYNMKTDFKFTNDLHRLKNNCAVYKENFAFIPLPYYTSENIWVGNEHLIFEYPFSNDKTHLRDEYRFYDARFFVFRNAKDINSLHRSVSVSFKLYGNSLQGNMPTYNEI